MKRRNCSALFLALLLSSCTSATNISKVYPFSSYVGKTVTLDRPMAVVPAANIWTWRGKGLLTLACSVSRGLTNTNDVRTGDTVYALLPAGHQVHIDCVQDEVAFDVEHIVAYGRTTAPPAVKQVRFVYSWGYDWVLEPAPWEPATLPRLRYLPSRFHLPPHFDYDMFRPPTNAPTWDFKVPENPNQF